MKLKCTIFLVLLNQFAVVNDYDLVTPEEVGLSSKVVSRLNHLFALHVNEKKIAGSVILMIRHGKTDYLNASGQAGINVLMQIYTVFTIVSMIKSIPRIAVMLFYEQGKLLLSGPISKYIPEFKKQKVLEMLPDGGEFSYKLVPVIREGTIDDLSTHQSGLSYLAATGWFPNLKRLRKLPLYAQPCETWEYRKTDLIMFIVVMSVFLGGYFGL